MPDPDGTELRELSKTLFGSVYFLPVALAIRAHPTAFFQREIADVANAPISAVFASFRRLADLGLIREQPEELTVERGPRGRRPHYYVRADSSFWTVLPHVIDDLLELRTVG